jgi:deoxycytidylate deaminase
MPLNYYSENETKDSNPDIYFMRQALLEAQKAAQRDEVPVGAVVVCQGRIIARGYLPSRRPKQEAAYRKRLPATKTFSNTVSYAFSFLITLQI